MKKRIFAMLLSALLVANISACHFVSKYEIEEITDNAELNFEETEEKITESETNAETEPTRQGSIYCNGVLSGKSEVTYTVNQNNDFIIHIADWNEDHLLTSFSAKDIGNAKYSATAIGINSERAFFLRYRHYENKITVVSFEKGSQSETVVTLDVDEDVYKIGGNFINENIGYLFAFKEAEEVAHSRGSSKLSNLYKTEDGGNTWNSVNVQSVPLTNLREPVIFAKMINEDVGLFSGGCWASDYNFCERSLLTTDGGVNWFNITALPIDDLSYAEVTDFTLVEGAYILTVEYCLSGPGYGYAKYQSSDLNTWIRIS